MKSLSINSSIPPFSDRADVDFQSAPIFSAYSLPLSSLIVLSETKSDLFAAIPSIKLSSFDDFTNSNQVPKSLNDS